ncbi:hypothetical protein LIN78_13565 [Leeia sp. TBRC 13508]|uniref:ADP-heptose--LPS heptosyltransferase n=1 Tax=Leeia speluncae TaxID=2884804 RepID=A0ABS8D8P0_9NEIS|nr:hypothetical protein [Leeia speluncae]MCB6184569.1 hypothetical protein [Leeia speluncae]
MIELLEQQRLTLRQNKDSLTAQALLDRRDQVWLPYDRVAAKQQASEFRLLSTSVKINNAHLQRFRLDYSKIHNLLIINGMGITLGDSIIGMSVLMWLLDTYPHLHITLWRSSFTPSYVEALYINRSNRLHIKHLPCPANRISDFDASIDLSDFMFRPDFDNLAMIDFFLESLGLDPFMMPVSEKANTWLSRAFSFNNHEVPYVLFCPRSCAKLRSIPEAFHFEIIDQIWKKYGIPIKGFSNAKHPQFTDLSNDSRTLNDYAKHISNATCVITTDSASVHLAAGFHIPTIAYFVSIKAVKRTRDYPMCSSINLDQLNMLDGLHTTDDPDLLNYACSLWEGIQLP